MVFLKRINNLDEFWKDILSCGTLLNSVYTSTIHDKLIIFIEHGFLASNFFLRLLLLLYTSRPSVAAMLVVYIQIPI